MKSNQWLNNQGRTSTRFLRFLGLIRVSLFYVFLSSLNGVDEENGILTLDNLKIQRFKTLRYSKIQDASLFKNSRFKDLKIQGFKDSRRFAIQRFKMLRYLKTQDSRIQRFKDSKVQKFKDSRRFAIQKFKTLRYLKTQDSRI